MLEFIAGVLVGVLAGALLVSMLLKYGTTDELADALEYRAEELDEPDEPDEPEDEADDEDWDEDEAVDNDDHNQLTDCEVVAILSMAHQLDWE